MMGMDGSNITDLVTADIEWSVGGLTVDYDSERIFWTAYFDNRIE